MEHRSEMVEFNTQRFAAISDVHGNIDALNAMMDDLETLGIESVVNLGDHLSGPLAARETADYIMSSSMVCIRGNHDRLLTEQTAEQMGPSETVAYGQLDSQHLAWLRDLPATRYLGDDIFLCHGTPTSDTTYWLEAVASDGRVSLRPKQEILSEAKGVHSSLMLCGHTHTPRRIEIDNQRCIVNPGSVGGPGYDYDNPVQHIMQTGTPTASYAIIEKSAAGWLTTFRNVPYDRSRMVELAKNANRPEWKSALDTGWIE
ncbi:metallophosphoesterase family protein [uncultured Roseobacter sp.]|uniref:metallophosphoesterase family protein n=1 Tax=uncultured Roseobacter sp. TaxID=114847 RepID=UPI00260C8FCF|nr:metallophosphoesterase family protein [uncultured Roseobacter sp.]